MPPGVVHAWVLRTAHAPRIAASLRRLRLVSTGETHIHGDVPGGGAAVMFRRPAAAVYSAGTPQSPRHQVATATVRGPVSTWKTLTVSPSSESP